MILTTFFLYLDPGSGSFLVQAIIAGVLGALFFFKNLWWKVKAFFWRPKKEETSSNDPVND